MWSKYRYYFGEVKSAYTAVPSNAKKGSFSAALNGHIISILIAFKIRFHPARIRVLIVIQREFTQVDIQHEFPIRRKIGYFYLK